MDGPARPTRSSLTLIRYGPDRNPATTSRRHHPNPAEAHGALAGERSEPSAQRGTVCSKQVTLLDNANGANRNPQCPRNRTSTWNVRWPAIRAWGQYHSRNWIDGQPIRAAPKAPERKRLCRSRALSVDPCHFVALRSERMARRIDAAKRTREPQHE